VSVAFRISEKDVDRYPGLRAKWEAAKEANAPLPKPKAKRQPKPKAEGESGSAYIECDVDQEAGGARHWVLPLPDIDLINANEVRGWHWRKEREVAAAIRAAAAKAARDAGVPLLSRARVLYLVHPTGRTRIFDPSNWALSAKAAVDGLPDAGVFKDDNAGIVTGVDPRAGKRIVGARIRMTLVVIDQGEERS
jgi:hypothetical protein